MGANISWEIEYIPREMELDIINYKYKGGSDSITYEYFWSSLC